MRRRTKYVNEIKTSLTDEEYDALLAHMSIFDVQSAAEATRKAVRLMLFGTVGNLPANLLGRSEEIGQTVHRVAV
jgi:hypothetical protein